MTKPATPKTSAADSAPMTWKQVQESLARRDKTRAELLAVVERAALAEADLALARYRLDLALATLQEAPQAATGGKL
jgi:hypothetical protein